MSKSSSEYSDVYLQLDGTCWAYSSCNVVMRFIAMVFNTYDLKTPNILIMKTHTKFKIENLETFIYYLQNDAASLLELRQCFYFFLFMIAIQEAEFFVIKLIKKGVDVAKYLDYYNHESIYTKTHDALDNLKFTAGYQVIDSITNIFNFLKKCKSVKLVKDVFIKIINLKQLTTVSILIDELCDKIFDIIIKFNEYVKLNNIQYNIKQIYSSDRAFNNILKKMLNQNLYSVLTTNYKKMESDKIECIGKSSDSQIDFRDHAMTIIGYLMNTKQLVVKNSWGTGWCEGGISLWNTVIPKNINTYVYITYIDSNLPEYNTIPQQDFEMFDNSNKITYKNKSFFNIDILNNHKIVDGPRKNSIIQNSLTKTLKKYRAIPEKVITESPRTRARGICEKNGKEYILGNKKKWKCVNKCLGTKTRNPKTLRCVKKK